MASSLLLKWFPKSSRCFPMCVFQGFSEASPGLLRVSPGLRRDLALASPRSLRSSSGAFLRLSRISPRPHRSYPKLVRCFSGASLVLSGGGPVTLGEMSGVVRRFGGGNPDVVARIHGGVEQAEHAHRPRGSRVWESTTLLYKNYDLNMEKV